MAELLKNGQRVTYLHQGEWSKGIIHGVKTHETPDGQITRVAYLVDTGKKTKRIVEDLHHKTHEWIGSHQEETDQPEQIEVDQNYVKTA